MMQKRTFVAWFSHCLLLIVPLLAFGDTYVNGEVYGVWDASSSPYYVETDITVAENESLTIYPGVQVFFLGNDQFEIKGKLSILGAEDDSVLITSSVHSSEDPNWTGLIFTNTADPTSIIRFATIHNCITGVQADTVAPKIEHSLIHAEYYGINVDGAILEITDTDIVVEHCAAALRLFSPHATLTRLNIYAMHPTTSNATYGIYSEHSNFDDDYDTFINMRESNVVVQSNGFAKGVFLMSLDKSDFFRNVIYAEGKHSAMALHIFTPNQNERLHFVNQTMVIVSTVPNERVVKVEGGAEPSILNSIIYGNDQGYGITADLGSTPNVAFCDIYGVNFLFLNIQPSDTCYNLDPCFKNFSEMNYHITSESPCIDTGCPDTFDPDGTIADIGRYYFLKVGVEPDPYLPLSVDLLSAYPNPFNSEVKIELALQSPTQGSFAIYNQVGQIVYYLQNGKFNQGNHIFHWNAESVASGMYWAVFNSESQRLVQPLILIK